MSEQEVFYQKVLPYLRGLGYEVIRPEQSLGVGSQRTRTDAVAYDNHDRPAILVEIKEDMGGIAEEPGQYHPVVQQAYRAALIAEAPYFLVSNGVRFLWFQVNLSLGVPEQIEAPPKPMAGSSRVAKFHQAEEFQQILDSIVRYVDLSARPGVFTQEEVLKLLQAKVCDELNIQEGQGSQFYADVGDAGKTVARLQEVYRQWSPTRNLSDEVPDRTWAAIASLLQPFSLLQSESRFLKPALDEMISSFLRSDRGQFVTPSSLVGFMVDLMAPEPGERMLDPACGTGGFLTAALTELLTADASNSATAGVYGVDIDPVMVQIARTNVAVSGGRPTQVYAANSLDQAALDALGLHREGFDLILVNPPFGSASVDDPTLLHQYETAHHDNGDTIRSRVPIEGLFLEQCVHLLGPRGRMSIVVSESLLSSPTQKHMREWLMQNMSLDAVISLPLHTFVPYTSIKTSVLVLSKRAVSPESTVFMASAENIGHDRSGRASDMNDLPGILDRYRQYRRTRSEFAENDAWTVSQTPALVERLDVDVHRPEYRQWLEKLDRLSVPVVRLKDIARVVSRGSPAAHVGTGVPIVNSPRQMKNGRLDLTGARHAPQGLAETRLKRFMLQPGDLVISSRGQVGDSALVTREDLPVMAGDSVIFVRLISGSVSADFLQLIFSSDWIRRQIQALARRSTMPTLLWVKDLKNLLIPVPDRSIQDRLSSRLREAAELRQKAHALEQDVQTELLGYLEDAENHAQ